jgi:hypothetical protein
MFYGRQKTNPTYDELKDRLTRLETDISGFNNLKNNASTLGEILTKLEKLCEVHTQQTAILADLQSRINALETDGSPIISTVGPTTTI